MSTDEKKLGEISYDLAKKVYEAIGKKAYNNTEKYGEIYQYNKRIQSYLNNNEFFNSKKLPKNIDDVDEVDILPYIGSIESLLEKDENNLVKILNAILDYYKAGNMWSDYLRNNTTTEIPEFVDEIFELVNKDLKFDFSFDEADRVCKKIYNEEFMLLKRELLAYISLILDLDSGLSLILDFDSGLSLGEKYEIFFSMYRDSLAQLKRECLKMMKYIESDKMYCEDNEGGSLFRLKRLGLCGKQYISFLYLDVNINLFFTMCYSVILDNNNCNKKVEIFHILKKKVENFFEEIAENMKEAYDKNLLLTFSDYFLYLKLRKRTLIDSQVLKIINEEYQDIEDTKDEHKIEILDYKEYMNSVNISHIENVGKNNEYKEVLKKFKKEITDGNTSKRSRDYKRDLHTAGIVAYYYFIARNKLTYSDKFEIKAFYEIICNIGYTLGSRTVSEVKNGKSTRRIRQICNNIVKKVKTYWETTINDLDKLIKCSEIKEECIPVIKVGKKECEKVLADLNDENFLFNPSDKYEIRPAYLLDRYHWSVVDTMVIEEIAAEEEKNPDNKHKVFFKLKKNYKFNFCEALEEIIKSENVGEDIRKIAKSLLDPPMIYLFENEYEECFFCECLNLMKYKEVQLLQGFFAKNELQIQLHKLACLILVQLDSYKIVEQTTFCFGELYKLMNECLTGNMPELT